MFFLNQLKKLKLYLNLSIQLALATCGQYKCHKFVAEALTKKRKRRNWPNKMMLGGFFIWNHHEVEITTKSTKDMQFILYYEIQPQQRCGS